jgi:hypothetical protein
VLRRSLSLVLALAAATALAPAALAVRVHVRVEGRAQTLFGAAEPLLEVKANALDALEAASVAGEFYYHVKTTSFGPFVDQIGRYPGVGASGWVFKVNGALAPVGADQVSLKEGDTVLWYWATFDPAGHGTQTLRLERRRGRPCYRVWEQDDAGKLRRAAHAILHVDGRSVRAPTGAACVGRHRGLVRATAPGDVRSNALP